MTHSRTIPNADKTPFSKIKKSLTVDMTSGLCAGVTAAGLFNPYDRALYLSIVNSRPFLTMDNFRSPYQGFPQALVQRVFLGSIYFVIQSQMTDYLYPYLREDLAINETLARFCIGSSAGSMSGMFTNPISATKYHTWGCDDRTFTTSMRGMWKQGGIHPFLKGIKATMMRDMVFGSTYEVLRHTLHLKSKHSSDDTTTKKHHPAYEFLANLTAAGIATTASGPFNYARDMQYASPPDTKPPTVYSSLCNIWQESKKHKTHSLSQVSFFQKKFRIGWGTARVAVGVALSQYMFQKWKKYFSEQPPVTPKKS